MQQPPRQKPRGRHRVLAFAQPFRHKQTAFAALAILLSILLREALLWQQAHGRQKHILVLADPAAQRNPLHYHDLHVMAGYMARAGFQVTEADPGPYQFRDRDDEALWQGLLEYDVIVTQGLSGMAVADYAARVDRPVARFIADPESGLLDPVDPASERPDIMVLGHDGKNKPHHFTSHFSYARQRKIPTFPHLMTADHPEVRAFMRDLRDIPEHTVHCRWDESRGDILGLVMIVKNETDRINSALLHMRDVTDFYTVVDTASQDDTIQTVRELLGGVPGQTIQHGPLQSFADARNHALKAHGNRTQWVLMADADYTLHNAWRLRAFAQRMVFHCELAPTTSCNRCFKAVAKYGLEWLDVSRVFPAKGAGTEKGWFYRFPVVETLQNERGWNFQMLHALNMSVELHADSRPMKRQAEFDLPTLIKQSALNASCARTAFFLAVMHHNVGHLEEAFQAYGQRLTMGGASEELYECHLRRGKLQRYWGQDPRMELIASSKVLPYRAEPLYDLAHYHSAISATAGCPPSPLPGAMPLNDTCALLHIVAAYHYARRAAKLPIPTAETLYLDASLYEYRAAQQLTEVAMALVWRLVSVGVKGRLGALEVMRSVDTITGRMLYRRGDVLLRRLEDFHKNVTHDLVWIGLSGGRVREGRLSD